MKTNRLNKNIVMILFFILFTSFCKIYSYATIHDVTFSTYNVNCYKGDTLVFYGGQLIRNWVTINDTTILDTIALSDGYIGKYKIKGSEKSFCIANGEGPWYGSITILISGIINDNAVTPNISLFPNPTYSTISIKDLQTAEIFVYGQCGQLVKSFTFKNTKIIVNLSEQKQGIYFFEIISNKNRGVYKILKL